LNRQEVKPGEAGSLIRLFSLLRDEDFGNNYHHQFKSNFKEHRLEEYAFVWRLHNEYNGNQDRKLALRKYYTNELVAGIQRYANRNAPELALVKNEILLGSSGGIKVTAPVELKGDYDAILQHVNRTGTQFFACLKVDDKPLPPIPINLNLFELLHKLNHGYRPNKYDKNAIVMLDEIIDQVTDQAKASQALKFYENGRSFIAKVDDGMIAISGMGGIA
jgi:DNA phosphorothioation-dependent restriction protein DptF